MPIMPRRVAVPAQVPPELVEAAGLQQQGRFAEAETLYRQVLARSPGNFYALHQFALLHRQRGDHAEALRLMAVAVAARPDSAEALANNGLILHALGRDDEALASYDRAVALRPDHVPAMFHRANALFSLGRHAEALAGYDTVIAAQADHIGACFNRGNALRELGRPREAVASYERVLAIDPGHEGARVGYAEATKELACGEPALSRAERTSGAAAAIERGNAQLAAARHEEAAASYGEALKLTPGDFLASNKRGIALNRLGRYEAALAALDKAVIIQPRDADASFNRGIALHGLGRHAEAVSSFERTLAISPDHVGALLNRGIALEALDRPAGALACYDRALKLKADPVETHNNRGNALTKLGQLDAALASFNEALTIAPEHAELRFNRSIAQLMRGDFSNGWREYEWRWQTARFAPHKRAFDKPLWLGREPLEGRTILLHNEQGLGDTIQFARYASLVAARGAQVLLMVQKSLVPLMSALRGVDAIVAEDATPPPFSFHCPLMSLPFALRTQPETIPASVPYLAPPKDRIALWRERLAGAARPRIGIVWSGRARHRGDSSRSIPFPTLAPLISAPGKQFISLQRELRDGDRAGLADYTRIVHLGPDLTDFADTAAIIAELDLVITVDTASAHVAGAMGKPVWIMLPFAADFRWFRNRSESPWYPTARLFRQPTPGDWPSVVAGVAAEIASVR